MERLQKHINEMIDCDDKIYIKFNDIEYYWEELKMEIDKTDYPNKKDIEYLLYVIEKKLNSLEVSTDDMSDLIYDMENTINELMESEGDYYE